MFYRFGGLCLCAATIYYQTIFLNNLCLQNGEITPGSWNAMRGLRAEKIISDIMVVPERPVPNIIMGRLRR